MLRELLESLTPEQRAQLRDRGISDQKRSDWVHGRRLPTEVQVAELADVTGADWARLQREITLMRAPEPVRERLARSLGKALAGVVAMLAFFGPGEPAHAAVGAGPSSDNVYYVK
jgi:hypothetical protein